MLETKEHEAKIKEAKRIKLFPKEKYVLDPPQTKSGESGEDRFKLFEWYLENGFSWKRHLFQKEFHAKAGMVLSSQIIGADWERIGTSLIKERKWDMNRNSKMLLGRGPRRFGKSVSMAMLAAAYALVTPYSVQSIFSTSQRISVYLGELIYKAICDAGLKHRIKKFGEERMEIYGPEGSPPDDIRKVFYYPANAKIGTRLPFLLSPLIREIEKGAREETKETTHPISLPSLSLALDLSRYPQSNVSFIRTEYVAPSFLPYCQNQRTHIGRK
jgi:hypothetical protein